MWTAWLESRNSPSWCWKRRILHRLCAHCCESLRKNWLRAEQCRNWRKPKADCWTRLRWIGKSSQPELRWSLDLPEGASQTNVVAGETTNSVRTPLPYISPCYSILVLYYRSGRGDRGVITNTASILGLVGGPIGASPTLQASTRFLEWRRRYAPSFILKWITLIESNQEAAVYRKESIRINSICPG